MTIILRDPKDVERIEKLEMALEIFRKMADETLREWDQDNDTRVGKMLVAMAGGCKGYRPEIDAIHAVMAETMRRGGRGEE